MTQVCGCRSPLCRARRLKQHGGRGGADSQESLLLADLCFLVSLCPFIMYSCRFLSICPFLLNICQSMLCLSNFHCSFITSVISWVSLSCPSCPSVDPSSNPLSPSYWSCIPLFLPMMPSFVVPLSIQAVYLTFLLFTSFFMSMYV